MNRADTWMPLYIGDYLADTMHLGAQEHGAYLLLLMHYWRNGPLPDDDRLLSGIARVGRKVWCNNVAPVVRQFFEAKEGLLHQKRADAEREAATQNSEKRRAAGKLGGEAKSARQVQVPVEVEACATVPDHDGNPLKGRGFVVEGQACDGGAEPSNATFLPGGLPQQNPTPRGRAVPSPSPREEDSFLRNADAGRPGGDLSRGCEPAQVALVVAQPVDPRDARTVLFTDSLRLIRHMTGQHVDRCRSILGRLLRDLDDDASVVVQIVADAAEHRPAEPLAWIMGAAKARRPGRQTAAQLDRDWDLPSLASPEMLEAVDAVGL